jgi:hypothetical protein
MVFETILSTGSSIRAEPVQPTIGHMSRRRRRARRLMIASAVLGAALAYRQYRLSGASDPAAGP